MTTLPSNLSPIEENDLRDLVDHIRKGNGNVVLFIGSGLSTEAGLPSTPEIGSRLAEESGYTGDSADLPSVAQYYQNRFNRKQLISRLSSLFDGRSLSREIVTSYDLIAELAVFPIIVTTNWDDQIEKAFSDRGTKLKIIKTEESLPTLQDASICLLKLHGDFASPPSEMVITKQDYVNTFGEVGRAGTRWATLGSWLQTKTVLFVGYSLQDQNIKYLLDLIKGFAPSTSSHYAVMREVDPYHRDELKTKGVRVIENTAKDVFVRLFTELRSFANRDEEIQYICNQMTKPFVEVYGPIQCGKSQLLREAQKRFRLKVPDWDTSLVPATETHYEDYEVDEFALISQLSRDIIKREITRSQLRSQVEAELRASRAGRPATETERDQFAAKRGAEQLADSFRTRQIAIFFDNVDRLSQSAIKWLDEDFLPRLWHEHVAPSGKVRVVFAGRFPTQWPGSFVRPRLWPLQLSPFGQAAVTDMLCSSASLIKKSPLPKAVIERMVERILWLSGGHPRAIKNLLQHLAEPDRKFDVYMGDPKGGAPDYFQQYRQVLFDTCVYPVIKGVLDILSPDLRSVVHCLAAFRHFNKIILQSVVQQQDPPMELSVADVSKEIQDKHLLQQPVVPLYALDSMIRYILAEWLEIHHLDRFTILNRLGANQFDEWISQMDCRTFDSEFWRNYVLNSLFHWLTLVRCGAATIDELNAAFQRNLGVLPQDRQLIERSESALRQLRSELYEDDELFNLANGTIGKGGYETLLRTIDERIDSTMQKA